MLSSLTLYYYGMFAEGQCCVTESEVVLETCECVCLNECSCVCDIIQSEMLVKLCCLRNQVWVWPVFFLWRPILGF